MTSKAKKLGKIRSLDQAHLFKIRIVVKFRGSNPGAGSFFRKSQIFLITRGFQKFWQKTCNQKLLFYYSKRRGGNRIIAPSSDSRFGRNRMQGPQREGALGDFLSLGFEVCRSCSVFWNIFHIFHQEGKRPFINQDQRRSFICIKSRKPTKYTTKYTNKKSKINNSRADSAWYQGGRNFTKVVQKQK